MSNLDILCPGCNQMYPANSACPNCGSDTVSATEARMDSMIQGASVPDLASLMRKAKDQGVIGPVSVYGEGAPSS